MNPLRINIALLFLTLLVAGWSVDTTDRSALDGPDHGESGLFFIESIPSTDYPGGIQNWAIIQDNDGILYVANNLGVMVFDGEHWELISMPNDSGIRSLAKDGEGRIFVGAQDEFGYLMPDDVGTMQFVSLVSHLESRYERFGDIRSTVTTPQGVYFQANEHLFRWSWSGEMDVWDAAGQFGNIFSIDNTLYVHQYGEGLMVMQNDSLRRLPDTELFAEHRVQAVVPHLGGGLLIGTFAGRLFTYRDGEVAPFEAEINDYVFEHDLYRVQKLSSGHLMIGTIRGGALLIQPTGELVRKIDRDDWLPGITVLSIYEDNRGGVWLGFNTGLARIDIPFAFTRYDHRLGFEGLGVAMERHEGRLYAASTSGVYVLERGQRGHPAQFRMIPGTQQQCFDLLSTESGLLAACGSGILRIDNQQAGVIEEGLVAYSLYQSTTSTDRVYLGLIDGLGWLQYENGTWRSGRVDEINEPIRTIIEDEEGVLWLGTDYQGALRVTLADATTSETTIERFDTDDGLSGGVVSAHQIGDDIVFSSGAGFNRVRKIQAENSAVTHRLEAHADLNALLEGVRFQSVSVQPDGDDVLWLFAQNADGTGSTILRAQRDNDGRFVRVHSPLQRISGTDIYAQFVDEEQRVWLSTQNGLLRYDETIGGAYFAEFPVLIRSVSTIGSDALLFGGSGPERAGGITIPYEMNALRFTFAAPAFNRGARTQYRVWLEGFDEDWSAWTTETRRDYTNLPGGVYTFHVQAKNAYGLLSDPTSYTFTIMNPWYQSWWAILAFAILTLCFLAGIGYSIYWYRARQLRARTRILEQRVQERTHALRQRTRTLERANLELRTANEQKSEFLGVAAHDLKNPLGGIIETSSFLIDDARTLDGEALRKLVQEFVPMIHTSSTRMLQIIDDLLQAHVIEEEESELFLERVDMAELVYSVLRWNRTQAENKDITLYFRPPEQCEAMVDETQMQRILDNLISNAIKFSPRRSAVKVRLEEAGDMVRISVSDEGPGLTEEDKEKVFGKLQLLSAKPTGGEHSSGLGLYIVKELVENHGGHVHVESEYGKGATFIIEIPRRIESEAAEEPQMV